MPNWFLEFYTYKPLKYIVGELYRMLELAVFPFFNRTSLESMEKSLLFYTLIVLDFTLTNFCARKSINLFLKLSFRLWTDCVFLNWLIWRNLKGICALNLKYWWLIYPLFLLAKSNIYQIYLEKNSNLIFAVLEVLWKIIDCFLF